MYSAENEDKSSRTSNVFSYHQVCVERRQMSSLFEYTSFTYCPNDNS